jgi:hypothetical protein
MKKILLSMSLFTLVLVGRSQTVLNEVYTEPGAGKSEFFELYNSATGSQNVNCFTIVTYWESGANKGLYVLDLPNISIPAKGWFTGSSSNPFAVQSLSGQVPSVNWNDLTFRGGSTDGYLKKYQLVAGVLVDQLLPDATAVLDLMSDVAPTGASGHNYFTFVYVNGAFNNGFWGGGPTGTLPSGITTLPGLTVPSGGGGCSSTTINFATVGALEFVNSAPGSDNGYARTTDGKCGAWVKTSAGVQHTPNASNGGAAGLSGSLTTSQVFFCHTGPNTSRVDYNITGVSGSATEADDFPVEVQLYYDFGTVGQLDGADIYQSSLFDALISDPLKSFTITPQDQDVILVYKTKRGCFDKVFSLIGKPCLLPVDFKSFTAIRNHSNVLLKWETSFEQNSSGFAVERNTDGTWQEMAFVSSQAPGGNSSDLLSYQYIDVNNAKGISQYRIRQVDFDNKSKFSEIRTVRGEAQIGKIIIYPNPTMYGKVNVSFEDASLVRDVSLMDMSGRVLKQWKALTNNSITIENLTPGMYTLRVVVPETGEQTVEKIVVNKR